MKLRHVAMVLVLLAVGVGAFFAGRASVSTTPTSRSSQSLTDFQPLSVSFDSANRGWSLGSLRCDQGVDCLALVETTNGGRSWKKRPLPASLLAAVRHELGGVVGVLPSGAGLSVRFANSEDGWIYGLLPIVWSTHDGGATWHEEHFSWIGSWGSILDLEAAGRYVYLMAPNKALGVSVARSPVAADDWQISHSVPLGLPAGGSSPTGSFVFSRSSGWLVVGNDRGTTGSARLARNGSWRAWTPPCFSVGHSYSVPAAPSPRRLVAVCTMGGFASPLTKSAPRGATLGSSWLYFSSDGGNTFTAGPELQPVRSYFAFFNVFASPRPDVLLINRGTAPGVDLIASFDGGVHWSIVYRGQLFYLAFIDAHHGVGLVQASNGTTTMIISSDAGRHWTRVTF